ncbi:RPE-retinal G protein-coupled receptor-like [Diadema antillarum]|uniref:RPE-retinal G protein-coupled receptor-like n=1 Tax=Diadema antillarum TaxID=105358 RepID=UPI003A85F5CC
MAESRASEGLSSFEHKATGVILSIEGLLGIAASGFLLISLLNSKGGRDPSQHALRVSLAIGDLAIGLMCPVVAIASFSEGWPYGSTGCQAYAFVANFFGLISIWSLVALVIYRHQTSKADTKKEDIRNRYSLILAAIWAGAFFWSVTPLPAIGWGRYCVEPFGTGCLLDFSDREPSYFLYLVGFSGIGLVIPLLFLLTRGLEGEGVSAGAVTACWKAMLVLCLYWGCYGFVALGSAIGGPDTVPVRIYALAPLLAKLCPTVNPLVFGKDSSFEAADVKEQKKH